MAGLGSTSLSTDKISLPTFIPKITSEFSSKTDDKWSSFRSLSEAANGMGSSGSSWLDGITDKVNSTLNGAVGTINDYINGFDSKLTNVLEEYIPKNLSFNTNQLGFFENILCGNIPSLGVRLPSLNTDFGFWKALDVNWNITICGKTEVFNPLDTALSIIDDLKNGRNPINSLKYDLLGKLINSEVGGILNDLGVIGVPTCLLNDFLIDSRTFGESSTLRDRIDIDRYISGTDCLSQAVRGASRNPGLSGTIFGSLLTRASTTEGWLFNRIFDYIDGVDPDLSSKALKDALLSGMGFSSNKFETLMDNYGNPYRYQEIVYTDEPVYGYVYDWENQENRKTLEDLGITVEPDEVYEEPKHGLGQKDDLRPEDLLRLRTDAEKVLDSLKEDENFAKEPGKVTRNVVGGLNLLDPTWMYDSEGNRSLYKTKNNDAMHSLARHFLNSLNKNELDLSGSVTTRLSVMHEVAIVNSFA